MHAHGTYPRLLAAIGTAAVLAVASSAPSFAKPRIPLSGETRQTAAHWGFIRSAEVRLVSLGYGCGDLEMFVLVGEGQHSQAMC